MKKLALAVSVATIVAAPLAQAGSTLTGSLRYGVAYTDDGVNDGQFSAQNFGSRIKWAGDTDLGNGATGYGKLELRLNDARNGDAQNTDGTNALGVVNRMYAVGIKGGFGDLSFGVQDTAYDIANPDRTWWNGGYGLTGKRNEKNGAVVYKKGFGDIDLAIGAQMVSNTAGEEEVADIVDAGVKYSANNIMLAAAIQSDTASEGTATAVSGGYNFGAGDFTVTYGIEDEDFTGGAEKTGLDVQVGFGNFYGWYGQTELDGADSTPFRVGVGYTQSLNEQMLVWYELFSTDLDDDSDATMAFNAALKIDF